MQGQLGSTSGNYWLGLNAIHQLTASNQFKLNVVLTTTAGITYSVNYTTFAVGDASTLYALTIGGFSGSFIYDAFSGYSGYTFATYDHSAGTSNCASLDGGAWWYNSCTCTACLTQSNFEWDFGFNRLVLSSDTMSLICP